MDFVTFEVAKKLKEKDFQEECLCHYIGVDLVYNIESPIANNQLWFCHNKYDNIWHRDNIDAPTISQVLKWLRTDKEIMVFPIYSKNTSKWYCSIVNADSLAIYNFPLSDSYEQAALVGIEYALDNLI